MTNTAFIFGLILIALGFSILTGFSFFQLVLGAILVWVGVRMLAGHRAGRHHVGDTVPSVSHEDLLNEVFVFSPVDKVFRATGFKGGKMVVVFAGGTIDLSQVETSEKEIAIEIVAVFGGVKLIVPSSWQVRSEGTAIFGGYDNRSRSDSAGTVVHVKGSAVFGEIEIVNG